MCNNRSSAEAHLKMAENKRGRKKVLMPDWLKYLMQKGWCAAGPYQINGERHYIKTNGLQDTIRKFDTRGLGRYYKAPDFFGSLNSPSGWWYLTNRNELNAHLEHAYKVANDDWDSNRDKRKSFTMLMHANNFHWSQCCQHKRSYEGGPVEGPQPLGCL